MLTEIIDNIVEKTKTPSNVSCAKSAEEKDIEVKETNLLCQNDSRAKILNLLDSRTYHDEFALTSSIIKDVNNLDNRLDSVKEVEIKKVNVEDEKTDNQFAKKDQITNKQTDVRLSNDFQ